MLNSVSGLKVALQEFSFILELLVGIILLPLIIYLDRPNIIKVVVLFTYLLILVLELINTSIEKLCDRVTTSYDEQIRDIKDVSSAAVFVVVVSFLIEMFILFFGLPKL